MTGSNPAFSLEGRVAVVTAAAHGIGRAVAQAFADAGARLLLADIDGEALEKTAHEIGGAATMQIDVVEPGALEALGEKADSLGPVKVWLNGVGFGDVNDTIVNTPVERLDRMFAINARSTYVGAVIAARLIAKAGGGSVINISSGAGEGPSPGLGTYAMCKAAVNSLTKTMAAECGPDKVRVNAIAPGLIHTPAIERRVRLTKGEDPRLLEEHLASVAAKTPLGQYGLPNDIAMAALYLACDASRHVTGQIIRVNGGTVML